MKALHTYHTGAEGTLKTENTYHTEGTAHPHITLKALHTEGSEDISH